MAKKVKVPKKKVWKEPDEFVSMSTRILSYLSDNQRKFLTIAVTVLLIVVLFVGLRFHSKNMEKQSATLYNDAVRYYHGNDNTKRSAKNDENRFNLALDKLRDIIENYPRTPTEPMAFLYSGHIHYELKEFDESIKSYEGFLKKASSENPLRIFAFDGLGYGYEAKGDYEDALVYFRKLIDATENPLSKPAYFNLSRCYEQLGEKDKAIETYQNVLTNYPNSSYASLAKEKINILKR